MRSIISRGGPCEIRKSGMTVSLFHGAGPVKYSNGVKAVLLFHGAGFVTVYRFTFFILEKASFYGELAVQGQLRLSAPHISFDLRVLK